MSELVHVWKVSASGDKNPEQVSLGVIKTLDEGTKTLPGGGYTTFRTFEKNKILRIDNHLTRLEETAILSQNLIRLDHARIKSALHTMLNTFPSNDARVRIILDLEQSPGDLYFLIEPLRTPSVDQYHTGVGVLTRVMQRQNPKAKLTGFIETASAARDKLPAGENEILMVGSDGTILEGLSSNFFAVHNGTIITADDGVLSGITRQLVLEEVRRLNIPIEFRGLPAEQLQFVEEAFITSASRAVLPVTSIDDKPVGSGKPGPITRELQEAYRLRVEQELEEV
jgi:branched-subunit amino acid aminotransferase/4-amino-4-deoxychorismate lyase